MRQATGRLKTFGVFWGDHSPIELFNLAVPKCAEFGNWRWIYAGFLRDNGWGGTGVMRELVQDSHGWPGRASLRK